MSRSPSTLHVHHHDGRTTMTSRCTKSFHAIHVDQIGKIWEATLIVAIIKHACGNDDPFAKVKFTIPSFYGLYDAKAYLDCEMTVDNKFSMQTSWRMCGKVVARKERLKTSFATYLALVMQRINTRWLAGQTDECIGTVCCWIGGIG
jgi:hypothetical protein